MLNLGELVSAHRKDGPSIVLGAIARPTGIEIVFPNKGCSGIEIFGPDVLYFIGVRQPTFHPVEQLAPPTSSNFSLRYL
jgi:hypothetical protein